MWGTCGILVSHLLVVVAFRLPVWVRMKLVALSSLNFELRVYELQAFERLLQNATSSAEPRRWLEAKVFQEKQCPGQEEEQDDGVKRRFARMFDSAKISPSFNHLPLVTRGHLLRWPQLMLMKMDQNLFSGIWHESGADSLPGSRPLTLQEHVDRGKKALRAAQAKVKALKRENVELKLANEALQGENGELKFENKALSGNVDTIRTFST
ncbi:uncharacterized protein G2W53_026389 [Senna tora]|uniref:Uncharacterized protein n=1 Tax=Senna tora TaxID=362788 RepID=A0A834TNV4_9FABA|nr:uncharacterized protein G2W53_026389 [Senna tora]